MNKFDVKNFDPNKNYVIEASAGTGKTYNIVEIVDQLVNKYNEDLYKILIVTYTEKAAGELKSRIRDKIKGYDVDKASIYTIHSFCQNVIKEFGLSAGLPFNLNVINESEIYNFSERYIREGEILKDISSLLLCKYELNLDILLDTLVKSISKYYLNSKYEEDKTIVSLKEDVEESKKLLKEFIYYRSFKSFDDLLLDDKILKTHYLSLSNSKDEKANQLANILSQSWDNNFDYNGKIYQKSKKWPVTEEEKEAIIFFKELKDKLRAIKPVRLLTNIYLQDFYKKWQIEKEINKNQTFDDMIRFVREAILKDDRLKEKLKQKYKRAIIDEFQDTNQKQFDIFSRIFIDENDQEHNIIVVGDPKQSIYSFQGADVDVYYNAKKAIAQRNGEICMLNKNYRSTADMVDSCNKLFNYYDFAPTTFENCGFLSKVPGSNEYHDVLYDNKDTKAFWIVTDSEDEAITPEQFANVACAQIIDCCEKDKDGKTKLQIKEKNKEFRNVSFKDFSVLARTSSEMEFIEKALKNSGIPYLRYKDKKLFLGRECAHWICLLKAINALDFTGRNRNILKRALFTNFFGLSLEKINSEYVNKDDINEVVLINKWKQLLYEYKYEDLFDDIIISSKLTEKMKSLKEIQSLSIYKQIANYCIEYLSKGKSIEELIRSLTALSKNGSNEDDDENGSIVEKSTNFDCVQIMTIHASKGLQFPVVIGVCGFKGPNTKGSVYTYHENDLINNNNSQVLTFDRNEIVKNEEIAEWKRLYYVAYTRAQFITILPFYNKYGAEFLLSSISNFMEYYPKGYRKINDKLIPYNVLRKQVSSILSNNNGNNNEQLLKEEQDKELKKLIKLNYKNKVFKHSYSSLSHEKQIIDEPIDLDEENKEGIVEEGLAIFDTQSKEISASYDENINPITLSKSYPKGAKLGTALHEIFENLDFSNYQENLVNKIKKCFLKQGVNPKEEWINSTLEIVENVLNANLPIINGNKKVEGEFRLNTLTLNDKLDEVEFNFNLLKDKLRNYCNGFVDMIFKRGEYYSIVDWKSDKLNDDFDSYANITSLKKHVNDCYSIQRVLYSYCLIKWLKLNYQTLSEQEIFDNHFGGIYYIFLRGCNMNTGNGVYCQTWDSWDDLEKSFNEIIKAKVGGVSHERL